MNTHGIVRGLVWLTLAASAVLAVVVTQTPRIVSAEHAETIVAAAVICIGAGWVAMIPPVVAVSSYPDYLPQAGLASVTLRLLVTLGVGMAYLTWARPPHSAFLNALAVWYLVLLVVETVLTVLLARRLSSTPPKQELLAE